MGMEEGVKWREQIRKKLLEMIDKLITQIVEIVSWLSIVHFKCV
jgi:hypothetical protein